MAKIKNYYLIWDDCSDISFTVYSFTQYILNNKYDEKQLIECKKGYINTTYSYVILNNQLYTIWSNIIIGDKNIICIST